MWSRRKFVFSTLAGLALWADGYGSEALSFNHKRKQQLSAGGKLTLLSGEYWSPAIACNFIGSFGNDLCCIVDEFGRLITADISPTALRSHSFPVLGRVDELGNKVFDLKVTPQQAVAVVWNQTNSKQVSSDNLSAQDGQFAISIVNLVRPKAPSVVSITTLPDLSEFKAFAMHQSTIAVAGIDGKGQNQLWLYNITKGRKWDLHGLATISLHNPVKNLAMGNGRLLIKYDSPKTEVGIVDLSNLRAPKLINSVKVNANDSQLVCDNDIFAMATQEESGCIIKIGDLKKFPAVISHAKMDVLQAVQAIAISGNKLMVLGNSFEEESKLIPFLIDKNHDLYKQQPINLETKIDDDQNMEGKFVIGKNNAFIGFGWEGVQVVSNEPSGWKSTARYSVPKTPVASQIVHANYLVLAGADLRLYDLKRPQQPQLIKTCKISTLVNEMVLAGSYVLCLDKNDLSLRKIENLCMPIAQMAVSAKKLCFDSNTKKAYLIQAADENDKKKHRSTKVLEVNVYADKVEAGKSFAVIDDASCASASDGYVVVGSMEGLAVYQPNQDKELVCRQQMKNLAWRDVIFTDGKIFASAVDRDANGFFYAMSFDGSEINVLGSVKIPHDVQALAVKDKYALCTGQKADGSNLLVVIDLSDLSSPKITSTQPVLESASAISYAEDMVIVSGRGFEIFRLKE